MVIRLESNDRKQLIDLLINVPELETSRGCKQILNNANLENFIPRIDFSGSTFIIVSEIIDILCKQGYISDDKTALGLFLSTVKDFINFRQKVFIKELLTKYKLMPTSVSLEFLNYFRVPKLEDSEFIGRTKEIKDIVGKLLSEDRKTVTILSGIGGCGKTTLAKKICYDDSIQQYFLGGIFWVELGEELNAEEGIKLLYEYLTGRDFQDFYLPKIIKDIKKQWSEHPCLIVVDNVEVEEDLHLFLSCAEENCIFLITTHNRLIFNEIINSINFIEEIKPMLPEETALLLANSFSRVEQEFSEEKLRKIAVKIKELAGKLYEWPIIVKFVMKKIHNEIIMHKLTCDPETVLDEMIEDFKEQNWIDLDKDNKNKVAKSLHMHFKFLEEDEKKYFKELFIFLEDVEIPLPLLEKIWGLEMKNIKKICKKLYGLSLLELCESNEIRIHGVLRKYFLCDTTLKKQLLDVHKKLVEYYEQRYHLKPGDEIPEFFSNAEKIYLKRFYYYHWKQAGKT